MYNRYSPGHGQSPNSVSFLWHDPSQVPPLVQGRIQLSNARAEGSHTFTLSLSLSPRISVAMRIFSHHPSSLTLSSRFFFHPCLALPWFSSRSPFLHSSIHACALAGYGWCGKNRQTHSHSWAHSKKRVRINTQFAFLTLPHNGCCWFGLCEGQKNSPHPPEYSQFSHAGNTNAMYNSTNFTLYIFYSICFYVYLSIFFLFDFNVNALLMICSCLCTKNNLVRVRIRSCVANLDAVLASNQKYLFFGTDIAEKCTNACLKYWNIVSNSGLSLGRNLG